MTNDTRGVTRRTALKILGGGGLAGLAGCTSLAETLPGEDGGAAGAGGSDVTPREPPSDPADQMVEMTAAPETEGGQAQSTWLYDEASPGPEIRATEGDVVGVSLSNQLSEETTIHWHGLPVANAMDGVPNVTQEPVAPGDSFDYQFRADPPGTYFYHSHAGLQLDRGLSGPLVVEETDPHVEYDREYVIVLDDHLAGEPRSPADVDNTGSGTGGPRGGMGGGGMGGDGMGGGGMGPGMGGGPGGMMNVYRPPYEGMVLNGRPPEDPPAFEVAEGERVRLRFVNAASATMFQVGVGGHEFEISHADGRPVEPVAVDSFAFAPGERYDAIVTADNPGSWEITAAPVRGSEARARGVLQYAGTSVADPRGPETGGRRLQYDDLQSLESLDGIDGSPDRTFDLTLSPGGDGYSWAIDGQVYPDADPLGIREGEHVRIRMQNRSPVRHPMHLHGHFFRVGNAIKDTVTVPGHMGQATIDFVADNPGDWFFHCHNLYHLEAGMARLVRYV